MRALLALLLMSAAAQADPQAIWGASSATLSGCRTADACVTVINMLSASPDVVDVALEQGGLLVGVRVVMGPGDRPDVFTVTVPRGFRVEPSTVTVEEGRSAVFRIYFPAMS